MNRLFRIFVVSLPLAGLAACASMDEQSTGVAPPSTAIGLDEAYVGRVEELARRRGIEIMWVNPPTERQLIADE